MRGLLYRQLIIFDLYKQVKAVVGSALLDKVRSHCRKVFLLQSYALYSTLT